VLFVSEVLLLKAFNPALGGKGHFLEKYSSPGNR
jgi:hypothetical protein